MAEPRTSRSVGIWTLAFAALGGGAAFPAWAAAGTRDVISLNSHVIDPQRPAAIPPALQAEAGGDFEYVLVKFPGPPSAAQLRALEAAVERVYTYLPYDAFLVKRGARRDLPAALGASAVVPWHPWYKLSRFVTDVVADERDTARAPAPRMLLLHVFPDAELDRVLSELEALGVKGVVGAQRNPYFSRVRLLLTPAEIVRQRESLARIPEVFWVDLEARRVLLNDTTVWVGQSGLSAGQTTPVFAHGIYGEGQVVGVLDTGIDPDMCYFRDPVLGLPPRNECNGGTVVDTNQRKVIGVDFLWSSECTGGIAANEWDTQNHGTHVAGTIAGDNFANPLVHDAGDGMAPGAKLVVQDCGYQVNNCADCPGIGCPVVDLNPVFQQTYDQGARLHSNSWGDQENASPQNNYTAGSQDVDEFMWNHPEFQIFFAAGNSGPGTATVGSPSTAKSAVSVGATLRGTSADSMASFSSCGPTDDGRIKPEVTVPGSSIVSAANDLNITSNNCNTRTMSGTSMATPGAAGLTALIRQYYMDGWYPSGAPVAGDAFTPSSALLRATLVNSARSMTGATAIPSNCQGWGRVLLDDALHFQGDARELFVKDGDTPFPGGSTNETRTYTLSVDSSAVAFKATLAWTDYPSTPAALPHINNDLDLEVSGPGGTYRGNVFAGGQSTAGGAADRLNTLEQVLLPAPTPGTYTVTVRSFSVPNGPQPFALVVTGSFAAGCTTNAQCDDGLYCNGAETCGGGLCQAGTPVSCNDGVSCTLDACNEALDACAFTPSNPLCDDGLFCNGSETCHVTLGCLAGSDPCSPLPCNESSDTCGTPPTQVTFTSVGAQDGWILESGETTGVGGSLNSTAGTTSALRVGDNNQDRQYKTVVSFDTSSLPDGATILSATLRLRRASVSGTNPFTTHGTAWADVQNGGFSGSTTLQTSDFEAAATVVQATSLTNAATNGAWSEGSLNAAGLSAVNKAGTTQLRVYFSLDDNDDGGTDYLGYNSGDDTTSANRPQLVVTYQ